MTSEQQSNADYENSTLSTTIRKLYLDSVTADAYFTIFDDEVERDRIPAHKSLLAIGSDAFKAMFYGDIKEEHDVKIVDASVDAFKEFLQFFYHDKIKLTMENVSHVVNLGKKYIVANCLNICEQFLKDSLTDENACFAYGLAIRYDLNDLKKSCETMIAEQTKAVFNSNSFFECDRSVLREILELNVLSCPETQVFHACMAWVKASSKQEQITKEVAHAHLDDLFYKIRYGSMTMGEFTALLPVYGVLFSSDEYQEIVQMIVSKEFHSKLFEKRPRQIQWNDDNEISCSRVKDDKSTSTYSFQDIEITTFSTNKPILLGKIVCAEINLRNVGHELPTEITIIECSGDDIPKIISHQKTCLRNEADQIITLCKPVLIKPQFMYDIQFKQSPVDSRFYAKPLNEEGQILGTDIVIQFQDNPSSRAIVSELKLNPITDDA